MCGKKFLLQLLKELFSPVYVQYFCLVILPLSPPFFCCCGIHCLTGALKKGGELSARQHVYKFLWPAPGLPGRGGVDERPYIGVEELFQRAASHTGRE